MRFTELLSESVSAFADLGSVPVPVPRHFSEAVRKKADGELTMLTSRWAVADVGELRTAHIFAAKINVLTLFFFPSPHRALPVYCLEQVVFGNQPIVGVLDVVCLRPMSCADRVKDFLVTERARYPQLQQADEMPDWYLACRSGQDIFIRPRDDGDLAALSDLHLTLLRQYMPDLLAQSETFADADAHQHLASLNAYKHHHQSHSPGIKLMNRSFGEAWTFEYLAFFFQ